jgi:chromosomal replication initiator protein
VVSDYYNIPSKALLAQNRSREVSQARHVAIYLSKKMTDSSLTEIGFKMGRRTHATVLHSIAIMKEQLEYDPVMRQRISQLEAALRA